MGAFRTYRVLILTASMGNGHLQVSRELQRRLCMRGHTVKVADLLTLLPPPAGRALGSLYPWLVNRAPWLYERIYQQFFLAEQDHAERASVPVWLALGGLHRLVQEFCPHVVVSSYHLAGVAAARLRASGQIRSPVVTFITTFGVHNLWLHPATDLYLCITPAVAAHLARHTAAPAQVCEPVVRPEFSSRSARRDAVARSLATSGDDRIALIVAGSLGLGAVLDTVTAVAAAPGWCPVVACGRNQRLRREVGRIPRAVPLGWVEDMASLMAAADVVLDNAAGSTAKEALAIGRPVVTFRPLPGHGRHDAMMMQQAGLTEITDDPRELARLLTEVSSGRKRAARVARGRSLFGTDPAQLIVNFAAGARGELAA